MSCVLAWRNICNLTTHFLSCGMSGPSQNSPIFSFLINLNPLFLHSGYHDIYIGASRKSASSDTWEWMNGKPWVYTPPSINSNGDDETCARIQPHKRMLIDMDCNKSDYMGLCRADGKSRWKLYCATHFLSVKQCLYNHCSTTQFGITWCKLFL